MSLFGAFCRIFNFRGSCGLVQKMDHIRFEVCFVRLDFDFVCPLVLEFHGRNFGRTSVSIIMLTTPSSLQNISHGLLFGWCGGLWANWVVFVSLLYLKRFSFLVGICKQLVRNSSAPIVPLLFSLLTKAVKMSMAHFFSRSSQSARD